MILFYFSSVFPFGWYPFLCTNFLLYLEICTFYTYCLLTLKHVICQEIYFIEQEKALIRTEHNYIYIIKYNIYNDFKWLKVELPSILKMIKYTASIQ